MSKSKKEVKEDRRKIIYELYFLKRKSIREICKELKWDDVTVWKDIQYLRKQLAEKYKDQENQIANTLELKEKLIKDAIEDYEGAQETKDKRSSRFEIKELQKDFDDFRLRTGIIRQAPIENVNINVDPIELMDRWLIKKEEKEQKTPSP